MTRRTHTPSGAFKRYTETAYYTTKFYDLVPWLDASLFSKVNAMHASAARKVRGVAPERRAERVEKVLGLVPLERKALTRLDTALLDNLEKLKRTQFAGLNYDAYERYAASDVVFSQLDMVMTGMAFFGSFVMVPTIYGGSRCSERGLAAFVHVWRVFGHYLGIEDRLNVAKFDGDLPRLERLLRELTMNLVVPGLLNPSLEGITMSKTVAKAYGVDYHVMMYDHCYAHGIELEDLWAEFSIGQKVNYYFQRLVTEWAVPLAAATAATLTNGAIRAVLELLFGIVSGKAKAKTAAKGPVGGCPLEKMLLKKRPQQVSAASSEASSSSSSSPCLLEKMVLGGKPAVAAAA